MKSFVAHILILAPFPRTLFFFFLTNVQTFFCVLFVTNSAKVVCEWLILSPRSPVLSFPEKILLRQCNLEGNLKKVIGLGGFGGKGIQRRESNILKFLRKVFMSEASPWVWVCMYVSVGVSICVCLYVVCLRNSNKNSLARTEYPSSKGEN